jgi:hypothetical protein
MEKTIKKKESKYIALSEISEQFPFNTHVFSRLSNPHLVVGFFIFYRVYCFRCRELDIKPLSRQEFKRYLKSLFITILDEVIYNSKIFNSYGLRLSRIKLLVMKPLYNIKGSIAEGCPQYFFNEHSNGYYYRIVTSIQLGRLNYTKKLYRFKSSKFVKHKLFDYAFNYLKQRWQTR